MSEPKYLENLAEKREASVVQILEQIAQERDEKDRLQRFGFFSIPYPAIIGDKKYSTTESNVKIVDHKVITERRGIYTSPLKLGKSNDVYFNKFEQLIDEEGYEKLKELNKQDHEKLMAKVHDLKEKKSERPKFKPSGPQEFKGFYNPDEPAPEREGTLTIEPDKKRFIKEGKVITERRGIFTAPSKVGNIPSEYFSYPIREDEENERLKQMTKEAYEKKIAKVTENKNKTSSQKPFSPASLKKCDPFFNNVQTYGLYTESEHEQLMNEYKDFKKNGRGKYQKILPKGAMKHLQPFKPARLIFTGRDGLLNDDLYKIPDEMREVTKSITNIREIREEEKKKRRVPFYSNKLMKHTHFSPSISSFTFNLKREFPSVKFY